MKLSTKEKERLIECIEDIIELSINSLKNDLGPKVELDIMNDVKMLSTIKEKLSSK